MLFNESKKWFFAFNSDWNGLNGLIKLFIQTAH